MCPAIPFEMWLTEAREAAGFDSQRAFAKHAHVSQATVNRWENGKRIPSRTMLEAIAQALNLPIRAVLDAYYGIADCA